MNGTFILAGNHLGNPDDIPARTLKAVRDADLVVFEEDRVARQVLKAAGIHRPYLLFSEHKQKATIEDVAQALRDKKTVIYTSDQGMPNVADPGNDLVELARAAGAHIVVIPGPSSITSAIAACHFVQGPFNFAGFLAREPADRVKQIKQLVNTTNPTVILDTPYRLKALIDAFAEHFPATRPLMLAIDISGPSEAYLVGTAKQLSEKVSQLHKAKLNFVLIVSGN